MPHVLTIAGKNLRHFSWDRNPCPPDIFIRWLLGKSLAYRHAPRQSVVLDAKCSVENIAEE